MDAAVFEQVYGAFQDFHAYFAPLFGRREARDHSRHYLQALLVQSGDRRNAENLSETVPASARVMQRFLAESPWDDDTVIGRLQEYLGPLLGHPDAVWVLDGSDFPKQGRKSVGVARQYCGRLGKVANCQAGMFLAYVSPLGRALVDKGLYLPESWTSDQDRCEAAGVPSPTALTAMTRTAYSTPSVSPLMVWVVPVTVSSETSSAVSQLPLVCFHCTLYPVTGEPPSLAGASQVTSRELASWTDTRT